MKRIFLFVTILMWALMPKSAYAVADPAAINWTASPDAFVTSLYVGILGRAPESTAVVTGWAAQVSSDPQSRKKVFYGFINSREHQGYYHSKGARTWAVYYENIYNGYRYSAASYGGTKMAATGQMSQGEARALLGWYQAFKGVSGGYNPPTPTTPSSMKNCSTNATGWRGTNQTLTCRCTSVATRSGSVWGARIYTDDSKICRAALHAGVISASGGVVSLTIRRGQSSYNSTTSNGVKSSSYGRWSGSYSFSGGRGGGGRSIVASCGTAVKHRGTGGTFTCSCASGISLTANVWGSSVYTDDSHICTAAVHAGVLSHSGGNVRVRMVGGRSSYAGSTRNRVSTKNYGKWHGSYTLGR